MSNRAAETIILASEEKLGVVSPSIIMPIEKATGIILNGKMAKKLSSALAKIGLDIHSA